MHGTSTPLGDLAESKAIMFLASMHKNEFELNEVNDWSPLGAAGVETSSILP
jgi:3-oxoacyl-(acyl-carrier-protein) synthase